MNLSVSFSLGVKEEYFSTLFLTKRFCSKIVLNKFIVPLKLVACSRNSKTTSPLSSIPLKVMAKL